MTVTQVSEFGSYTNEALDNFIRGKVGEYTSGTEKLDKTMRLQLYPAVLEMETRYQKKQGARTDLKLIDGLGWHDYLRSRGITPEAFRKWKSRSAISEIQQHLFPAKPRSKRKKEIRMLDESEASLIAQAGLRVASTLLNPLVPEKERVAKAVQYSKELEDAVQGGEYQRLMDEPDVEGLARLFKQVFVSPEAENRTMLRKFLDFIPEFKEHLREALTSELELERPKGVTSTNSVQQPNAQPREEHGGDDPVPLQAAGKSEQPLVGTASQKFGKKTPKSSISVPDSALALALSQRMYPSVRPNPRGGYGIYDTDSCRWVHRCETEDEAWDALAAANTAHRDAMNN